MLMTHVDLIEKLLKYADFLKLLAQGLTDGRYNPAERERDRNRLQG